MYVSECPLVSIKDPVRRGDWCARAVEDGVEGDDEKKVMQA